jgi:hypothetical protein
VGKYPERALQIIITGTGLTPDFLRTDRAALLDFDARSFLGSNDNKNIIVLLYVMGRWYDRWIRNESKYVKRQAVSVLVVYRE